MSGEDQSEDSETRTMLSEGVHSTEQMPAPTVMKPGQRSCNVAHYQLEEEIGRGGMGVVYRAHDQALNRTVALKILPEQSELDPTQIQRFLNESRAAAQLNHSNIVPVYDVGEADGINYYSMQLIPGRNLGAVVKTIRSQLNGGADAAPAETDRAAARSTAQEAREAPTSPAGPPKGLSANDFSRQRGSQRLASSHQLIAAVATIGRDVADALSHAHEIGVVHRDVKPSNLLLDESGKVWITDFGLARIRDTPAITQSGVLLGTLRYMSPEQASGRRSFVDHRTDLYSLGVTLYELLTLRRAFDGRQTEVILRQIAFERPESIRSLNPSVPEDLETIVMKAMAHSPSDRYATAAELATDLDQFLRGEPISARPPSIRQQFRGWRNRHPRLVAAGLFGIAAVFLTSVASAGVFYLLAAQEQQQREVAEQQRDESEGLRLVANSALVLPSNPRLALELARKGATLYPSAEANQAILAAADANHEYAKLTPRDAMLGAVVLSPDGERLVSLASDQYSGQGSYPALIHSAMDGEVVQRLDNGDCITSAAFDPAGRFILTASSRLTPSRLASETIPVLWDATSGQRMNSFVNARLRAAHDRMFAPDGDTVVLPAGNEAIVFQADGATEQLKFRGHTQAVFYAEFSPDGQRVLTLGQDRTLRIWSAETGAEIHQLPVEFESDSRCRAHFGSDSNSVLVGDTTGSRFFRLTQDARPLLPTAVREYTSFAVSPTQPVVAFYYRGSSQIELADLTDLQVTGTVQVPRSVRSLRFDRSSQHLAVQCDTAVYLVDVATQEITASLLGHDGSVFDVALRMQNPRRLATIGQDQSLRLWHAESGLQRRTVDIPLAKLKPEYVVVADAADRAAICSERSFTSVAFDQAARPQGSPLPGRIGGRQMDASRPVTIKDDRVYVWNAETSQAVAQRRFPGLTIRDAQLLSDQQKVVVMTTRGGCYLWDLGEARTQRLTAEAEQVQAFDLAEDGRKFVIGTSRGRALIFDAETAMQERVLSHASALTSVAFDHDQQRLATVDSQHIVRVFDSENSTPVSQFTSEESQLYEARFVNKGQGLVTSGTEVGTSVELWNPDSGQRTAVLGELAASGFQQVVVHPDRPYVAIRSDQANTIVVDTLAGTSSELQDGGTLRVAFHDDRLITLVPPTPAAVGTLTAFTESARRVGSLNFWNPETQQSVAAAPLPLMPEDLRIDRGSGIVVVGGTVYRAAVSSGTSGTVDFRSLEHARPITCARFREDGSLVTASQDGRVQICSANGDPLRPGFDTEQIVTCGALSPDGQHLAVGDHAGAVSLWDLAAGQRLQQLQVAESAIRQVDFYAAGGRLLVLTEDGKVLTVLPETGERTSVNAVNESILATFLSPDRQHLLMIPGELNLRWLNNSFPPTALRGVKPADAAQRPVLVHLASGRRTTLDSGKAALNGVFHPVGETILLVTADGMIEVHDAESGQVLQTFQSDHGSIAIAAFDASGDRLVTRQTNSVSVWDWKTKTEMLTRDTSLKLSFLPGDAQATLAVTASGDAVFIGRRIIPTAPLDFIHELPQREFTPREALRFRLDLADRQ